MSLSVHKQTQNVISKGRHNFVAGVASCMRIVVRRVSDQVVHAILTAEDKVNYIEWSSNGSLILAVIGSQGILQIWSVDDLDWSARIDTGVTGLSTAHFHPISSMHVLVYSEFGIRMDIWNLQTHAAGHIRNVKDNFVPVVDPSGKYALVVCRDNARDKVLVIDLEPDDLKFSIMSEVPVPAFSDVVGLAWTTDSKGFIAWESPLQYKLYSVDMSENNLITTIQLCSDQYQLGARITAVSHVTSLACIGGFDGHMMVFSFTSPELVKQLADFCLEGDSIAIIDNFPIVLQETLGGESTLRERNVYQAGGTNNSNHPVEYREIIPDESTVDGVGLIKLHSSEKVVPLVDGKASLVLGGPRAGICRMEMSPDGRYVVAQTETKAAVLFVFDLSIMCLVAVLVHRSPVRGISWNPAGLGSRNELAIATGDTKIFLWSPSNISQTIELADKSFKPTNVDWDEGGGFLVISDSERMTTVPIDPHADRSGGCSGFLGKVILEKLMRSFSCERIYVLLRPKKSKSVESRFREEMLGSRIFDQLRELRGPGFESWATSLVIPIAGDLLIPSIGISASDRELLASRVSIIIHSAASVDFDLPLNEATEINIDGSLAMLGLAKSCRNLTSYVHVSTCYVNSHIKGVVQEQVYPPPFDPIEMYQRIKRCTPEELARDKQSLISPWPNTYTFTKFLAEHLLMSQRGDVPLVIARPAVIGPSIQEPVPGWTDSISAITACYFAISLGIMPVLGGNPWNIADVIPVDLCANMIILVSNWRKGVSRGCVAGGCGLLCPVPVMHCGTSDTAEPMTWFIGADGVQTYFQRHPPKKALQRSSIHVAPKNTLSYYANRFIRFDLPLAVSTWLAPFSASFAKMSKALKAGTRVEEVFSHFVSVEYIFESKLVLGITGQQGVADPLLLLHLRSDIDWYHYVQLGCYGMRKYCLRDDSAEFPLEVAPVNDALQQSTLWATGRQRNAKESAKFAFTGAEMEYEVPNERKLREGVFENENVKLMLKKYGNRREAISIINSMQSRFHFTSTRMFGYSLEKMFSAMYERVSVNEEGVRRVGQLLEEADASNTPVLLVPTHRSYIDFLMLSYILFVYQVKVPFIVAGEDFKKIPGVNQILRRSGAFFMRRKMDAHADPLYVTLFKAYFQQVLMDHGLVEFFIEGTRSRLGGMMPPKHGLLTYAMELVEQRKINGLKIVPVSMSYERVLEAESFVGEVLGEPKQKETLSRILGAAGDVAQTNYGRANIFLGTEVVVTDCTEGLREKVNEVAAAITKTLEQNMTFMITHLVAAGLLLHRENGVEVGKLTKLVESMRDVLRDSSNSKFELPIHGTCKVSVRKCLDSHFRDWVTLDNQGIVRLKNQKESALILSYYVQQIVPVFGRHGIEAIAMQGRHVVPVDDFNKTRDFLLNIFGREVSSSDGIMKKSPDGKNVTTSMSSEILYLFRSIIQPHLEGLWIALGQVRKNKNGPAITIPDFASQKIQPVAKEMFEQNQVRLFEVCSAEMIKQALRSLVRLGIINKKCQLLGDSADSLYEYICMYRNNYKMDTNTTLGIACNVNVHPARL